MLIKSPLIDVGSEAEKFATEGFGRELGRTGCSSLIVSSATAESGFN
jgi:hypothetical protein